MGGQRSVRHLNPYIFNFRLEKILFFSIKLVTEDHMSKGSKLYESNEPREFDNGNMSNMLEGKDAKCD